MEKYIDLHMHSTASDGTFTPKELATLAKERGLCAAALTDHDTIAGLDEFISEGAKIGLETVAGIEFAALYDETEIHIVGLFIDYKNKNLLNYMDRVKKERDIRNNNMIKKINDGGFDITFEELKNISGSDVITRAHYAVLMTEKGYVSNKNQAFDKYLGQGKPFFIQRNLPDYSECIKVIKEAGGYAILAHPTLYNMNYRQIRNMCKNLILAGLTGIEVMYSTYRHEQQREITRIADEFGLKYSGGSDFHGKNKPEIHIGVGKGNLRIPYDFIENLKK